jgi:UPF0716 protein FxsA
MVLWLILFFVVAPVLELAVFLQVADAIGFLPSVALILLFSVGGAWLMKQEGLSVARRAQEQLRAGEVPAVEITNGVLILIAGALMILPGFLSDIVGLFLLFPPTRSLVRGLVMRRFEKRVRAAFVAPGVVSSTFGTGFRSERLYMGEATYGGSSAPPRRRIAGVVDVHEVDDAATGARSSDDVVDAEILDAEVLDAEVAQNEGGPRRDAEILDAEIVDVRVVESSERDGPAPGEGRTPPTGRY